MIKQEEIISAFGNTLDFKKRLLVGSNKTVMLFYLEGMTDLTSISRFIFEPLAGGSISAEAIKNLPYCSIELAQDEDDFINGILRGNCGVIFENEGYLFDTRKTEKRSVEQPGEESSVKASKDSFVEELKINLTLLRKKIVSSDLKAEKFTVGRQAHTSVALIYMGNIANDKLINSVRQRLTELDVDGLITPGIIEQHFSKSLYSFFPQTVVTERPDKVCKSLLAGRCALLVDGLPICYILPATLQQFLATPEDYAGNFIFASAVRLLRYFLLGVEVLLPGMYVALTTFHYEMLPGKLALSIAASKSGVPFPVLAEILAMLALFEILIEAGLHMPQSSGQAVSIVGALVVGEAAINADLVSPAALIIVSISAICSFAMPNQEFGNALRLWRIIITLFGAALGLFGVMTGGILLLIQIASLESFSVPYLAPFAGVKNIHIKNAVLIMPDKDDTQRPEELKVKNKCRRK